jgi:hypothetical protein
MKDVNPRARIQRLIGDRNYLGAQLYLKEVEIEADERNELFGTLAAAVVDELSRTRREDRERIVYLRSVLAWILREIPGLGSVYREQLRAMTGGNDPLSGVTRGIRNLGDIASGRKSVGEGLAEAADDARRSFEDAADQLRDEAPSDQVGDFLSAAEKGIRGGLDQLGAFFRAMNEQEAEADHRTERHDRDEDRRAAARADNEQDVEDAEFTPDDQAGASGDRKES